MKRAVAVILVILFVNSCSVKQMSTLDLNSDIPDFSKFYIEKDASVQDFSLEKQLSLPKITIEARDMPLASFLAFIANHGNVSIIADNSLDNSLISLTVNDIEADRVLESVARKLNVYLRRDNNLFFIGNIRDEDNSIYVTKCSRLSVEEITNALTALMSQGSRFACYSDGLVIINAPANTLLNADKMFKAINSAPVDSWIVQFLFLVFRESDIKDLNFNVGGSFDLASVAAGDSTSSAALDLAIKKSIELGKAKLTSQPLIVMEDGSQATINDGEDVPIPKKSVSDQGTVTVIGVEYRRTGVSIDVICKDMGNGNVRLVGNLGIDSISGYNGDYPIVKGQHFSFRSSLQSNKSYLITAMTQELSNQGFVNSSSANVGGNITKNDRSFGGLFGLNRGQKSDNVKQLIQVWVRSYRIKDMSVGINNTPILNDVKDVIVAPLPVITPDDKSLEVTPDIVDDVKPSIKPIKQLVANELKPSRFAPYVTKTNPAMVLPVIKTPAVIASKKEVIRTVPLVNTRRPLPRKVSASSNHVPQYSNTPIELPPE